MGKEIRIVKAEKEDLHQIMEIEALSFQEEKFNRRQFLYLLSHSLCYVAKSENKVCAYVVLLQSVRIYQLRLYSIAVHPDARKKNIGKLLLQKAFSLVVDLQKRGIYLEVKKSNKEAISFYTKNGFTYSGEKKSYYPDGSDAWVMRYIKE
ncbi:MAG TPA: ribosomal protein S18-alanine N-acetyltransferase [Bacteroidales bacterium]|nr:ribosomal protein S18-alanine N-acetyltransferase [Bacteroidales bacterium]